MHDGKLRVKWKLLYWEIHINVIIITINSVRCKQSSFSHLQDYWKHYTSLVQASLQCTDISSLASESRTYTLWKFHLLHQPSSLSFQVRNMAQPTVNKTHWQVKQNLTVLQSGTWNSFITDSENDRDNNRCSNAIITSVKISPVTRRWIWIWRQSKRTNSEFIDTECQC